MRAAVHPVCRPVQGLSELTPPSLYPSHALGRWVCAIRLAGWEHARLQEVYTGHLIRASLTAPLPAQLTAAQPTIAGWFDVRTFGSRSWTHLWVVLSVASPAQEADDRRRAIAAAAQAQADATAAAASSAKSRKRLSNMFSSGAGKDLAHTTTPYLPPVPGDGSPTTAGGLAGQQQQQTDGGRLLSNVPVVKASFYLAPPLGSPGAGANSSSAGRRTSISQQAAAAAAPPAKPVLVLSDLHQAYAVFPETPAAVDASGMFKLEGALAGEAVGASGRKRDEGWCLLIPGDKRGDEWVGGGKLDMIRWLTGASRPSPPRRHPRAPSSLTLAAPPSCQPSTTPSSCTAARATTRGTRATRRPSSSATRAGRPSPTCSSPPPPPPLARSRPPGRALSAGACASGSPTRWACRSGRASRAARRRRWAKTRATRP